MDVISIRGSGVRAIAQAFHYNLVKDREKRTMRGPKTEVVKVTLKKGPRQRWWRCKLKCGHTVERPIKRRRVGPGHDPEDHAPDWVYCEKCCD
jgi:hypothetical protein